MTEIKILKAARRRKNIISCDVYTVYTTYTYTDSLIMIKLSAIDYGPFRFNFKCAAVKYSEQCVCLPRTASL